MDERRQQPAIKWDMAVVLASSRLDFVVIRSSDFGEDLPTHLSSSRFAARDEAHEPHCDKHFVVMGSLGFWNTLACCRAT